MCKLVQYQNGKYVADIKLKHINNIKEQAAKCGNISRIILFGSSTEERCSEQSDIDIAVFGRMTKSRYLGSREFRRFQDHLFRYDINQDYDILYFCDSQEYIDAIMSDIDKGVEIYRRD